MGNLSYCSVFWLSSNRVPPTYMTEALSFEPVYLSFVSRNSTTFSFKHSYSHIKNINALIRAVIVFSLSLPPALTDLCSLPKEHLYVLLFIIRRLFPCALSVSHVPHPQSDSPWFDHPDNIWRRVEIMKLFIILPPPPTPAFFWHALFLWSKCWGFNLWRYEHVCISKPACTSWTLTSGVSQHCVMGTMCFLQRLVLDRPLSLCSSLNVGNRVSHPYKITLKL